MSATQLDLGARVARPHCLDGGRAARAPRRVLRDTLQTVVGLPARGLLLLIRLYQRTLSPALPVFFGSACGCRFSPTCSHYAADAIRMRGALIGTALATVRLLKCTPLHPGGFDPVPEKRSAPRCVRIAT